ncbi:Uncharacterised protein [uncultured archaeon]|nr:Uncharacterised protein [uncultured archaeon]
MSADLSLSIGFPRALMPEEKRIALLPEQVAGMKHPDRLFFESGYGEKCGFPDSDYTNAGANICGKKKAHNLEGICIPKFTDEHLPHMHANGQTAFGWFHFYRGMPLIKDFVRKENTAIAWECMFDQNGTNIFLRNGLLTGNLAVLDSIAHAGIIPEELKVAIIGRGRVGTGARSQLEALGVKQITVYHTRNTHLLKRNLGKYDMVVGAACCEHEILDRSDLKQLKPGALLVDIGSNCIGCGVYFAGEELAPFTKINRGKNLAYCFHHVPTLAYKTASRYISEDVAPFIDDLTERFSGAVLNKATVIYRGKVFPERF